jgi:hypothetical protein
MHTTTKRLVALTASMGLAAAAVLAVGVLVWEGGDKAAGRIVVLVGAALGLAWCVLAVRSVLGRTPTASATRVAAGVTDERESQLATRALADAAIAMIATGCATAFAVTQGLAAEWALAAVLTVGLATAVVSVVWRTR